MEEDHGEAFGYKDSQNKKSETEGVAAGEGDGSGEVSEGKGRSLSSCLTVTFCFWGLKWVI